MTDTAEQPAAETAPGDEAFQPDIARPAEDAPESEWKAYARKWEGLAKSKIPAEIAQLREKATRFDELEESQKSELERLQDRLAQAEKVAADAEAARLRASIAAKHGVPEALLSGADEAALEQSAQDLLAFKGTTPAAPTSDGQGKQGEPVNNDGVKQVTPDELDRMSPDEIVQARAEGRLKDILNSKS